MVHVTHSLTHSTAAATITNSQKRAIISRSPVLALMLNTSNENLFSTATSTTDSSSPNRSKYEKKFLLKKSTTSSSTSVTGGRKPLSEKTKVIGNVSGSSAESLPRAIEFEDLFLTNAAPSSSENELKMALAESLRENEQLCDTVKLLKFEIERLQEELVEQQEYAELYLLSKELIEQQSAEISTLKEKLLLLKCNSSKLSSSEDADEQIEDTDQVEEC